MKLGVTVNLGGFQSMKFESSERETIRDCAADLVNQMAPLVSSYGSIKAKVEELRRAYGL